ncbi:hypothetical protein CFP65_5856 [Kitasatospora sp. MMS16-BH015]|uniref:alpha-galactosidase n=1 Tax=Kitasatospora sp. MMS16-BH015 TaxID=2018025 RepID=UPI000CA32052|nr:alpha-galactosidase [Kitasatospora sp. MMS16-BH015]AUG80537.1 hypothetical protein CFP65_5856 [Kitasatospora sp. MMS16-BH015]
MTDEYALRLRVRLHSGQEREFGPFALGEPAEQTVAGTTLRLGAEAPYRSVITPAPGERLAAVEYRLRGPLANFEEVIGPDSGRWFMNSAHPTAFWRFAKTAASRIEDVKTPLYLFTGRDRSVRLALGIVGGLVETDFALIEPVSNRALNVHTRVVEVSITRGTADYPLELPGDGSLAEAVYLAGGQGRAWSEVLREFSAHTRATHGTADRYEPGSTEPFWCSWTDWSSEDIDERMVLENVGIGLELGIRNFIVDDGWFGPGLDTAYERPLNIGDWQPDPAKFPDLRGLVEKVGALGGRLVIWCAPHAVGPAAEVYEQRRPYLIADAAGEPVICDTQFYSLCFQNAEARAVMAGICEALAADWGFHGAKYDLFNWIPPVPCASPHHTHDTGSAIEGLRLFLAAADERVRRHRPHYVVELKQNYGTALLSPYGTCMRAGDAPFDPDTNFLRTLHVQAYTPYALNDYQAFTPVDEPADVAVAVVKMLAAGIPAYGCDFAVLPAESRAVVRELHRLYEEFAEEFRTHRLPDDPEHAALRARSAGRDMVLLVRPGGAVRIDRPSQLLNGRYLTQVAVELAEGGATVSSYGVAGELLGVSRVPGGRLLLDVPIGGRLAVAPADSSAVGA